MIIKVISYTPVWALGVLALNELHDLFTKLGLSDGIATLAAAASFIALFTLAEIGREHR